MSGNGYKNEMGIDERVLLAIMRVANRFEKEATAVFKKHELSFSQYNLLRVLDASKDGRNTIKNVKQIMLVSSANMTGITKKLEKLGFISRKSASEDNRLKYIELTDKGRRVLRNISHEKEEIVSKYLLSYSYKKKHELFSMLTDILKLTKIPS